MLAFALGYSLGVLTLVLCAIAFLWLTTSPARREAVNP